MSDPRENDRRGQGLGEIGEAVGRAGSRGLGMGRLRQGEHDKHGEDTEQPGEGNFHTRQADRRQQGGSLISMSREIFSHSIVSD